MTRSNPLASGFGLLFSLLLALTGCGESTPTDPAIGGEVDFVGTIPGFGVLTPTSVRVQVRDGATAVADSTEEFAAAPGVSIPFSVLVQVDGSGPYEYDATVRDAAGHDLYRVESDTVPTVTGATTHRVPDFRYVGPGHDAAAFTVDVSPQTVGPGGTVSATAVVVDGTGSDIPDAPIEWTSDETLLELAAVGFVGGRSVATFNVLDRTGVATIDAVLPTGLAADGEVRVETAGDTLRADLMLPRFPGFLPTEVSVTIEDVSGTALVDTVLTAAGLASETPDTVTRTHYFAAPAGPGPYRVTSTIRDSSRDLYRATAQTISPGDVPNPVHYGYVGLGHDAATLSISPARDTTVVGDTVTAIAEAYDGSGTVIPFTPFAWVFPDDGFSVETGEGTEEVRLRAAPTPGTYEVRAITPTGIESTAYVTLRQRESLGIFIDFEEYPDGRLDRCGPQCPTGTEWSEWGIEFDFSGAVVGGGSGLPQRVYWFEDRNHTLSQDYTTTHRGWLSGYIHMEFTTPPPAVEFAIWYHDRVGDPIQVLDHAGRDVTAEATIVLEGTVDDGWHAETATIEYAGGIGEIIVSAQGARTWIDDISY